MCDSVYVNVQSSGSPKQGISLPNVAVTGWSVDVFQPPQLCNVVITRYLKSVLVKNGTGLEEQSLVNIVLLILSSSVLQCLYIQTRLAILEPWSWGQVGLVWLFLQNSWCQKNTDQRSQYPPHRSSREPQVCADWAADI